MRIQLRDITKDEDWQGLFWYLWHSDRRSIWLGVIIAAVLIVVWL